MGNLLPGLQSESKAIREIRTVDMVKAGDHLSLRTSKQITPYEKENK